MTVPEPPPTGRRGAPSAPARIELLEREHELTALRAMVASVSAGESALALVEGPAGIGKSRLMAELRDTAAAGGLRPLAARGSELEREFPFGVVRQLFEPLVVGTGERDALLTGAAAPAEAVFRSVGEGPDAGASFAALHGLYWLTVNLASSQPLMIAIDDLHWCDRPSLRFIAYLVRRLEGVPLLLAVSLRSAEPGTDPALIGEVAGDPGAARVHPRPLSEAGVAALVHARLGAEPAPDFTRACHAATGGNPLLLRQLLASLEADGVAPETAGARIVREVGPRAISRTVLLRLGRLPANATAVARAVAVLGDGAKLPTVGALARLDEDAVAEAIAALARAELLRPEPPLGFVHPLVRDAIYHELSPGERELQHARSAEVLHEAKAPAEHVAAHLLPASAVEGEWVLETLVAAARSALATGGAENAVSYLRRALEQPLDEGTRAELVRELGGAEVHSSGPDAAVHLREAYDALADRRERALVALRLAWVLIFTRREEEARRFSGAAAAALGPELADLRRGLEALELFSAYFGAGDHAELVRFEPHRRGLEIEGPGSAMLAAGAAYDWANTIGPREECVALARRALAEPSLFAYDQGLFWCGAVVVLVYAEEPDGLEIWDRILADVYRGGSLFAALTANLWSGYTHLRRGELDEAMARFDSAAEEGVLWGGGRRIDLVPAAFIAQILTERGLLDAARTVLSEPTTEPVPGRLDGAMFRSAEVELLLAEGRFEEARAGALALGRAVGRMDNPAAHAWRTTLAEALDRLGRSDEAVAAASEELELARRWGAPGPVGRALRVLGSAEREHGVDRLTEAVAVLEGSQMRLELARALAALGTALRLTRRPSEAREPLERALELATVCGATALAERVRGELHASGARPRREALSGPGALTPSERRVAERAASGCTNREIAQELYVTPKTVEVHLSNAYRKLGIGSRRELSRALAA